MKTVIRYKCEKCGAVFDTTSAALACEAKHYNLSLDEYNHWMALKKLAEDAGKYAASEKMRRQKMSSMLQ